MLIRIKILPSSDSWNSYPEQQEFIVLDDQITLNLDNDREISFLLSDLEKLIKVAKAAQENEEGEDD